MLLKLQTCVLAFAWVSPGTATVLCLAILERSHTESCTHIHMHEETASESQPFVHNHLPLLRDKNTQSTTSKPMAARLRNMSFHYLINKMQDQPDTTDLVPQCQQNNATPMQLSLPPFQCVNYYLCRILHWSACCQWNSLPWQSFGSIVLLQMVIISSDLLWKWNAFSPLSWLFIQNLNEIWT